MVTFMHQFRHHLLGRKFTLRTDHGSLRWLFHFKEPQGQMARWLEVLSQYNFQIVHRAGKRHQNADALSRVPSEEDNCTGYQGGQDLTLLPCGGCRKCSRMQDQWKSFHDQVNTVIPSRMGCSSFLNASAKELDHIA